MERIQSPVTPERVRLIAFAATGESGILVPGALTPETDLETRIRGAQSDDLPFKAGERVSVERRQNYWREDPERAALSFVEQNRRWNEGMHGAIRALIAAPENDDQEKARKAALAQDTLSRLELTGADESQDFTFQSAGQGEQTVRLYNDIEAFRKTYFNQKSDIKSFVKKIVEQCPGANGFIDIQNLTERLDAIKPILTSFGDQSVDSLVEDFAVSFGLLRQNEQTKVFIARETKNKLSSPIAQGRRVVYEKLAEKQANIDEQATHPGEEQETPREQPKPGKPGIEPQVQPQPPEPTATGEGGEAIPTPQPQRIAGGEAGRQKSVQPEGRVQPQEVELAQKIREIEEKLSEEAGKDVELSPEQIRIIREKGWSSELFIGTYYEVQDRFENEGEVKSHDQIMREVEEKLSTATIMEEAGVLTNDEAQIVFCRQIGAVHIVENKPCQDACLASRETYKGYGYTVMAVADGHGGEAYTHSDIGSRLAVQAVQEVAKRFIPSIVERLEQKNTTIDWSTDAHETFRKLFGIWVLKEWKRLVSLDFNKSQQKPTAISDNDLKKYGTTLAAALIFKDWVFSAVIGDSKICFLSRKDQTVSRVLPEEDEDSQIDSIFTDSMCLPNARYKWTTKIANIRDSDLGMIFLATDGFHNSFKNPEVTIEGIYSKTNKYGIEKTKKVMPRDLVRWSDKGDGDDISVIAYFPKIIGKNSS